MPYASADNPLQWRKLADEARRIAEMLVKASEREQMLAYAESYDRLAEMAEKREIAAQEAANSF